MDLAHPSFILDTSAYSGFNRGDERLRPWFTAEHTILIPLIVVGELRAGFAAGVKTYQNERLLERFLLSPNVQTLPLSLSTTEHFATLFLKLRTSGIAVSTNDLWIAALSLEHDTPVLTVDTDFSRMSEVKTITI